MKWKRDKYCSICKRLFKTGVSFKTISYTAKKRLLSNKWYIGEETRKTFICVKCWNTLSALIRNNLAIKTSDILDE